jgi:membrane protein implicated in regulation of membrane protease activity
MTDWFAAHSSMDQFFLLCAILGGIVLVLRFVLMAVGHGGDDHGIDAHHADSDVGFQFLSLQGLASFFTMFGVVGYPLHNDLGVNIVLTMLGATGAGVACVWIIAKLFRFMGKMQSSGTVDLYAALGSEGTVYLTVGKTGGTVQINFANRLREFDAVSADGEDIPTGTPVRVERIDANTLVVARR